MFKQWISVMIIIAFFGVVSLTARATDYFCHVKTIAADNSVWINGFPVGAFTNPVTGSLSHTQCVSNLLVNGTNRIDVIYSPTVHSDTNSRLRWTITTSPDSEEGFSVPAKSVIAGTMASRKVSWFDLSPVDFVPSQGTVNDRHEAVFDSHGTTVCWGGRLRESLAFTRVPSRLQYDNLVESLSAVQIRFIKSGTPISVKFAGITLPKGNLTIELLPSQIIQGAEWMRETGFDEIWIEGQTAVPPTENITLGGVTLYEIQGAIKVTKTFQVTQSQHWSWQDGDHFTSLSKTDKEGIWQALQTFSTALMQKDMPKLDELMQEKSKVIALLMQWSPKIVDASRREAFNATFKVLDPAQPPPNKNDIRYILINPQVVTIETFAGDNVVAGNSHVEGKLPYSYLLYYAHIKGKWVIIW